MKIILKLLVAMGILCCCGQGIASEIQSEPSVVSIRCKQLHMERPQNFSFTLEENEGQWRLTAYFYDADVQYHEVEHKTLSPETGSALQKIVAEQGIVPFMRQYKSSSCPFAPDQTEIVLEAQLSDGTRLTAADDGDFGSALRDFFTVLAMEK